MQDGISSYRVQTLSRKYRSTNPGFRGFRPLRATICPRQPISLEAVCMGDQLSFAVSNSMAIIQQDTFS